MTESGWRSFSILEKIALTADRAQLIQALLVDLKEVPITGKKMEQKPVAAPSGFGLKVKKTEVLASENPTQLVAETALDTLTLGTTLTEWFSAGYNHQLEFGETGIHLAFFDVQDKAKPLLSFPLVLLPVQLIPQPARGVYHLKKSPIDPFYAEEAGKLFLKSNAMLPSLPEVSSDIIPERLLRDIEDQGIGLGDYQLNKSVFLVLSKAVQGVPQGPFNPIEPVSGFRHITQPLSELYASQREAAANAIEKKQPLSSTTIGVRADLAVQTALASVLEDAPVLLVADDNQTLSFVEKKLRKNGTDRYVFPLYKSSDRFRFRELVAESIDRGLPAPANDPGEPLPLAKRFFESLIQKRTAFDKSPAELAQYLLENEHLPEIPLAVPSITSWTPELLADHKQKLAGYTRKDSTFDAEHFWKLVHQPHLTAPMISEAATLLQTALTSLRNVISSAGTAVSKTGLEAPTTLTDLSLFERRLEELEKAPVFPKSVFHHDWSPLPEKVKELLKLISLFQEKNEEIGKTFHPQILDEHLEELLPRLQSTSLSPMRFLNQRYKKDLNRLKAYTFEPEKIKKLDEFWSKLHTVKAQQKLLKRISDTKDIGERLFGKDWQGVNSNAPELMAKAQWLEHFEKRRMRRFFTTEEAMKSFLSGSDRDVYNKSALKNDVPELEDSIRHLLLLLLLDKNHDLHKIRLLPFHELEQVLLETLAQLETFEDWQSHLAEASSFGEPPLSEFLAVIHERKDIEPAQYPAVFEKSFYAELFQRILAQDPELQTFTFRHLKEITEALNGEIDRQKQVGKFLIARHQEMMRLRRIEAIEAEPAFAFVQHELKKSSRFLSWESFLARAGKVLVMNAPLWLIRTSQLEKMRDHLPLFKTVVSIDVSDRNRADISVHFEGFNVVHISAPISTKPTLGFGMKSVAKPIAQVSIPVPEFQDPWRKPNHELISTNSFGNGQIPFEIFEVLHDQRLDGRVTVVFPDDASIEEFWNQCSTLFSKDETIRNWYTHPQGSKAFRFVSKMTDAEIASDHAIVIMKKAGTAKTGLSFGIKKDDKPATVTFPRHLLAKIPGQILLMGESDVDASAYIEPEPAVVSNRFTALISSVSYSSGEWQIKAGHHAWEASLRHITSGKTFYMLADLPDQAAASLSDRFDYAGRYFSSAIAFSALAALRDKETALSRVFELAESKIEATSGLVPQQLPLPLEEQIETDEHSSELPVVLTTSPTGTADDFVNWLKESEPQRVPSYERITSKQEIQKPEPGILPRFEPYQLYSGVLMGDRQDFFEAPERRIQKLIGEIVDAESPIHVNNLYRAITAYWQIQRRDAHVQSVFARQLSEVLKKRRVFIREGCLYNTEDFRLKLRNRAEILDFVIADEIPLDEIEAAIIAVLEKVAPMEPDDLQESVSWALGLPARFRGFDKRFEKAVALLGDQKKLAWFRTAIMLHPDIDPRRKSVGLG